MEIEKRIVIIHDTIPNKDIFISSLIAPKCIPVVYSGDDISAELNSLRELILITPNVTHLTFVYDFPGFYSLPFYPDIDYDIEISGDFIGKIDSPYKYISKNILSIIEYIKTRLDLEKRLTIDLLSCSLKDEGFQEEIRQMEEDLEITVRYSLNDTGKTPDGDWLLESHGSNVKDEYFTEVIDDWHHVLNSKIESRNLTTIGTPGTFIKEGNTYKLTTNLTWNTTISGVTAITDYIELSNNEIFDGQGYTIVVPGTSVGLFTCASTITDYSNKITIQNLNIISNVGQSGGGFLRTEQRFAYIEKCKHSGRIGSSSVFFSGGIVGDRCGWTNGRVDICDCHSYGDIGRACGGIAGDEFCMTGGTGSIRRCTTFGGNTYNQDNGGITATFTGYNNGNVVIEDCVSTIGIGNGTGGMCGPRAGDTSGSVIIRRCSHQGVFFQNQVNGGGIVGGSAGTNSGYAEITDCFSVSKIFNAGGIAGGGLAENGRALIKNCYSLGNIIGFNSSFGAGGIVGFRPGRFTTKLQIVNCYAAGVVMGSQTANCGTILANSAAISPGTGGIRLFNCYGSGTHRLVGQSSTTDRIRYNNTSLTTLGATYVGEPMTHIIGTISTGSQYQNTITDDSAALLETTISSYDTANNWQQMDISYLKYCFHTVNKNGNVILPEYNDVVAISFWTCLAFSDGATARVIDLRTSANTTDYDFFDSINGYESGFSKLYVNGREEPYASPLRMSYASITRFNWAHVYLVLKRPKNVSVKMLGSYLNTERIDGAVRDIVLWNRELTETELYTHYNNDYGMITDPGDSRVIAYYTLNNTLSATIGSNGSATVSGTQQFSPSYIGSGFPALVNFMETTFTRGWDRGSYERADNFPLLEKPHTASSISNDTFLYDSYSSSYFQYKKQIFVKSARGAVANNYPIMLELRYSDGTDYGNVIYLDSSCQATFKDIRFADSSGGTIYPFWVEDKVDGVYARVWVNLTNLDLGTSDSGFFIYYGNPSAFWQSSTTGVFSHFTTFDNDMSNSDWISGTTNVAAERIEFLNTNTPYGKDSSGGYNGLLDISGILIKNTVQTGLPDGDTNFLTVGEIEVYTTNNENTLSNDTIVGSSNTVYLNNSSLYGVVKAYDGNSSTYYQSNTTGTSEFLRLQYNNNRKNINTIKLYDRTDSAQFNYRNRYEDIELYDISGIVRFRKERTSASVDTITLSDIPNTMSLRTTNTSTGVVTVRNPSFIIGNNSVRFRMRDSLRLRTVTKVIVRGNESANTGVLWKKDRTTTTNQHNYTMNTSPFTYGGGSVVSNTITEIGGTPNWSVGEIGCYDRYYRGNVILDYGFVDYLDTNSTPTLSGWLYLQNERGPVLEFDWIAVRNYIPFEPIVVGTSPLYTRSVVEAPPVGNINATRFYIPINYTTMSSLVDVSSSLSTAHLNTSVLRNILLHSINSGGGASQELSPLDISLLDYTVPVSFTTLMSDIKNLIHQEAYESIVDKYKARIFGVSEEENGGNIPVMMKSFIDDLSGIESRNSLVFEGDPSDLATVEDISINQSGMNNIYSRLQIDGKLSGNTFLATPGYMIGIRMNIDATGNLSVIFTNSSGTPVPGGVLSSSKTASEILTSSEYPIGKVKYTTDSTGLSNDGSNGVYVDIVLISCGGDRGILI